MNNKWILGIVVGFVGLLACVSILTGIGVVVRGAVNPVQGQLATIEKKLDDASSKDMKKLLARLDVLEKDVLAIKARMRAPAPSDNEEPEEDLSKVYDIPVDGSAILGKQDAPVTIVVFNDFQCPFCARFHTPIQEVLKAYPDKVKFMIKHFPLVFHPMARPAAKAAMAAGVQGKFYEMSDLLFQNATALGDDKFKELAGKIGINVDQFMKDYKDRDAEWEAKIGQDMALAGKVGVRGTPSYFVNGRVAMARSVEQWKVAIDEILKGEEAK